ncbi:MAG: MerR family transcriptional regulator [Rhodospirillaceae bacterium]|nr:MerR family transcriptional regulator [Rhodospirillaceae bacterium]|tara:strand:- start:240 stop:686 length:447 start_codon:yes stop_codon:yes gene_type:complete
MADQAADFKSGDAFRTISEVSTSLDIPQHVLRFWETKFSQVKPMKRAGGRRYYRPSDIVLLGAIRTLLYDDGYTIRGVQKILREKGVRCLVGEKGIDSGNENNEGFIANASASTETDTSNSIVVNAAAHRELSSILEELLSLENELRR